MTDLSVSTILAGVDSLKKKGLMDGPQSLDRPATTVARVLDALSSFSEIVRYLNTRRSTGAVLDISGEAAVQDVIYLMLRPWVLDLTYENPTDKVGNRYTIKDFVSHTGRFVVEAKYIRNAEHGKHIISELNDDIETYRYHRSCDDLIFFIYDPESYIPDAAAVERHLRSGRSYDGKVLRCHAVIKP
ncbi:MAG: hypothetical protein ACLQM6_02460 [Acidobacteriaceae bacterium]